MLSIGMYIFYFHNKQVNASSEKKSVLESLDREELIRKCKGLLVIAQKAKKSKDGLSLLFNIYEAVRLHFLFCLQS